MGKYTLTYNGFDIDPVKDPHQVGAWEGCPIDEAEMFEVYPPTVDDPKIDTVCRTLTEAVLAVDAIVKDSK